MDIPMTISITNEVRPCYFVNRFNPMSPEEGEIVEIEELGVKYKEVKQKALFHMWLKVQEPCSPGPSETAIALVEYEDGDMDIVDFDQIRFADANSAFREWAWVDHKDDLEGGE